MAQAAGPELVQAVSYEFTSGNQTGAGVFRLFADGTFRDAGGSSGSWTYLPANYWLVIQYQAGQQCAVRFLGQFTSPTTLQGRFDCTDGSPITGTWNAVLVAPFQLSEVGCPMTHCDEQMSDWAGLPAPSPI